MEVTIAKLKIVVISREQGEKCNWRSVQQMLKLYAQSVQQMLKLY